MSSLLDPCAAGAVRDSPGVPPQVFERPVPRLQWLSLAVLLAITIVLALQADAVGLGASAIASSLFMPSAPVVSAFASIVCRLSLAAAPLYACVALPRWYGRVEAWPGLLVVHHSALPRRWGRRVVTVDAVVDRSHRAHGLRLHTRSDFLEPVVVPSRDDQDTLRIHRLLDADRDAPTRVASAGAPLSSLELLFVIAFACTVGLAAMSTATLGGPAAAAATWAFGSLAVVRVVRVTARRGGVHAAAFHLAVNQHVLPWESVAEAWLAQGRLALRADDGRRLWCDLGRGREVDALRRVLAKRLAESGVELCEQLPTWAREGGLPGRTLTVTLVVGALSPWVASMSAREVLTRFDHLGQTLHVVYRRWDGRPDKVVVVIPDDVATATTATLVTSWSGPAKPLAPGSCEVNLAGGLARFADGTVARLPGDATVIVIGPAFWPTRVRVSYDPLPPSAMLDARHAGPLVDSLGESVSRALTTSLEETIACLEHDAVERTLARVFPGAAPALIREVQDGTASRRVASAHGSDATFAVRLAFGRVEAATIQPPLHPRRCGACEVPFGPGALIRVLPSGEERTAHLLSWQETLEVLAAIRRGATVESASRALAPDLWTH